MSTKQGEENTEIVKEKGENKEGYVFQKNTKTITGFIIVLAVLAVIILGIIFSGLFLESSS